MSTSIYATIIARTATTQPYLILVNSMYILWNYSQGIEVVHIPFLLEVTFK